MPWGDCTVVKRRFELVERMVMGECVTSLCEEFGVSRKTAYKWLRRYEELGFRGLEDRSTAPHRRPTRTCADVERLVVSARMRHPRWGPKKLLWLLMKENPGLELPARSTVASILQRHGLSKRRRRRLPRVPHNGPLTQPMAPNDVWAIDFKGEFKLRNGKYCYPLTVSDLASRMLLVCVALPSTSGAGVAKVLGTAFEENGLPSVIRSDNGTPFASMRSMAGVSTLSANWWRMGIIHERTAPGRPDQNGSHERMHRTLKEGCCIPPRATMARQQQAFDDFRQSFNHERPHEALGMNPPAILYKPSDTPLPAKVPTPRYPAHFERKLVYGTGELTVEGHRVFVGHVFSGHELGLEPVGFRTWRLHFCHLVLATYDANARRFTSKGAAHG